ncbi:MAG: restriction endonuclease subunit S [Kiritimatiellae bacterium]|nr:restriction endonuclease subunit S [Kiritimatiellia bacterium]
MRYEKYKQTGIPWLPEVPEEWTLPRVRQILRERIDKSDTGLEEPLSMSQKYGILPTNQMDVVPNAASTYVGAKRVKVNDIVFNKLKAHLGVFAVSAYDGLVSPDYAVYQTKDIADRRFIEYLFHTPQYISEFRRNARGVAQGLTRLYTNDLFSIRFICPTFPEQRAIVAYLDDKCGKIDELVAAKEKEVELLKELKQTVIADAVTRGISHAESAELAEGVSSPRSLRSLRENNRRLVPSGIPWLPQIPEGWEVRRVHSFLKVKDCVSAPEEELLSVFLDRGVIRFSEGGEKRANATAKDLSKYQLVEIGDFVLNNQQAWRGSVGVSRHRGIISPAYFVVKMDGCIDASFADFAFRSKPFVNVYEFCSRGVGSIQRNLIWNMFKQQHFPIPPRAEQRAIVAYIEEKTAKIDQAVAGLAQQVAALKEYKQRLIADVVTGQMRVA